MRLLTSATKEMFTAGVYLFDNFARNRLTARKTQRRIELRSALLHLFQIL